MNFFYNIKQGIKNLIRWFPIIWNDYNWDHHYILVVLKKKLELMEKAFRSDKAWGADSQKEADNMRCAINLLDRMVKDDYLDEALKPFDKKYPDYKWDFKFEKDENGFGRMVNHDTLQQKELMHQCFDEEEKLRDKDYDELFDFLKEHIREWWD